MPEILRTDEPPIEMFKDIREEMAFGAENGMISDTDELASATLFMQAVTMEMVYWMYKRIKELTKEVEVSDEADDELSD